MLSQSEAKRSVGRNIHSRAPRNVVQYYRQGRHFRQRAQMAVYPLLHRLVVGRRRRQDSVYTGEIGIFHGGRKPCSAVVAHSEQYRHSSFHRVDHRALYLFAFFGCETRSLACSSENTDEIRPVLNLIIDQAHKCSEINRAVLGERSYKSYSEAAKRIYSHNNFNISDYGRHKPAHKRFFMKAERNLRRIACVYVTCLAAKLQILSNKISHTLSLCNKRDVFNGNISCFPRHGTHF